MKRIFSFILVLVIVTMLVSCGDNMISKGKEYKTIGLVNLIVADSSVMEVKDPNIQYEVIWGNVVWGVILCETIIAPIYFFGFSMFEPIALKKS